MGHKSFGDISASQISIENEGIIGLGLAHDLEKKYFSPLVKSLVHYIDQPKFTIGLKRDVLHEKNTELGEISFGSTQIDFCDSNVDYVPIAPNNGWNASWKVQADSYTVDGIVVNKPQIVQLVYNDNWLIVPEGVYKNVTTSSGVHSIGGNLHYIENCNNVDALPVITLKIGGKDYEIRGEDYTRKVKPKIKIIQRN